MNLLDAAKQALEALWDCTVKLESQQFRNPVQIPPIYTDIIRAGYSAHTNLSDAIEEAKNSTPTGYIVQEETADGFEFGFSASYPEAVHEHINEQIQLFVDNGMKPPVMHCVPFYLHPAPTPEGWQPSDDELTAIYNKVNGITDKHPPITTKRIFTAMRAMLAAAPKPEEK